MRKDDMTGLCNTLYGETKGSSKYPLTFTRNISNTVTFRETSGFHLNIEQIKNHNIDFKALSLSSFK